MDTQDNSAADSISNDIACLLKARNNAAKNSSVIQYLYAVNKVFEIKRAPIEHILSQVNGWWSLVEDNYVIYVQGNKYKDNWRDINHLMARRESEMILLKISGSDIDNYSSIEYDDPIFENKFKKSPQILEELRNIAENNYYKK